MLVFTSNNSDSASIRKFIDEQKGRDLLDVLSSKKDMIKTASTSSEANALTILIKALSSMDLKVNINIGELLNKLSESNEQMIKEAKTNSEESSQEVVKIASKEVQDSHYDIDICKTPIVRNGSSLMMVSAYLKEAYLGRYLIKRNFYFVEANKKDYDYVYSDLIEKFKRIRTRYLEGKICAKEIVTESKALLDATRGDIQSDEKDDIGTTVKRDKNAGHHLNGPMYSQNLPKG